MTRKIVDYMIIQMATWYELEHEVRRHIKKGWEPASLTKDELIYCQAMVKYEGEQKEQPSLASLACNEVEETQNPEIFEINPVRYRDERGRFGFNCRIFGKVIGFYFEDEKLMEEFLEKLKPYEVKK